MVTYQYDIFEDKAEIDALLEKNRSRSIDYLTKPEMWDDPIKKEKSLKKSKIQ